jgi:hypothetical protein
MKSARVVLAGVIGGLVMFAWSAVDHMILPIGEMGIRSLPAEPTLLPALKRAIDRRGLYFFPGMPEGEMSKAQQDEWADRIRAGPRGILVYDPSGDEPMSFRLLAVELLSDIAAAIVGALILVQVRAGWLSRAVTGMALGVAAWLSIEVSYWNWYRFPDAYTLGTLIDQGVGWLLAGAAIGLTLGRPRSAPRAGAAVVAAPEP